MASDDEAELRGFQAISYMRNGDLSLTAAARLAHTTPKGVLTRFPDLFSKPAGRWEVKPHDRKRRPPIRVVVEGAGQISLPIRDSRTTSKVARHRNAVTRFTATGDATALAEFKRKGFQVGGVRYVFLTDLDELERLANAGVIQFEHIYSTLS